jgi:hypothetical protein
MGSSGPRRANRARKAPSVRESAQASSAPSMPLRSAAAVLADVRRRLEIVGAVASVTHAALRRQAADADHDAITIQRCVADELDRQVEEIDWVIVACRALGRKRPSNGGG